jgi:hypothetical protein
MGTEAYGGQSLRLLLFHIFLPTLRIRSIKRPFSDFRSKLTAFQILSIYRLGFVNFTKSVGPSA